MSASSKSRTAYTKTLDQVAAEKVCYLALDMNCPSPEVAAAEFFWSKLALGEDPSGRLRLRGISPEKAPDESARSKRVQVPSLPTEQGLTIKPLPAL
jgi:O-methyltransferase